MMQPPTEGQPKLRCLIATDIFTHPAREDSEIVLYSNWRRGAIDKIMYVAKIAVCTKRSAVTSYQPCCVVSALPLFDAHTIS